MHRGHVCSLQFWHTVATFNPKHFQIWPIFPHTLEESFYFGQRLTVRILRPREKVLFTNSEGRKIKISASTDEVLQPQLHMEPHFKLPNEHWLHLAERLIFFQKHEAVLWLENALAEPVHAAFQQCSAERLQDALCESLYKNTSATSKERLKTVGTHPGCVKRKVQQRSLCQIPFQNYIT